MKQINTAIIAAILLFTSCSEDILEVENKGALTADNFYQTADDFQAALNTCYIPFMERGFHALKYTYTVGTFEDRILFETTSRDVFSTLTTSNYDVLEMWWALYHGVYRTSVVLAKLNEKGVDGIPGMTQEIYDYTAAQSRALRGAYYFMLAIFFDRPILYDEYSIPDDYLQDYGNCEREELWAQIEKDLSEAAPGLLLSRELPREELGRITRGAAQAMLAKTLLYKHYYYYVREGQAGSAEDLADLQKARDLFREVINSGQYELILPMEPKTRKDYIYAILCNTSFCDLPSENNVYDSENNLESVWEIQFSDDAAYEANPWLNGYYGGGGLHCQYFGIHSNAYKNHEAHPIFYDEFETAGAPAPFDRDPRCYATFYFDGDTMDIDPASPYYKGFKSLTNIKRVAQARRIPVPIGFGMGVKKTHFPVYWDGLQAPFNDPLNKRIIRYADVLLLYAETMFLLGDDGTGLAALNQVRARVDMPAIPALTREAIIHERDIELAFEGHRWFDLVRWSFDPAWGINWDEIQWGIDADNSVNPFVKGKHEFFPIPLDEIDINGGALKQNPGW